MRGRIKFGEKQRKKLKIEMDGSDKRETKVSLLSCKPMGRKCGIMVISIFGEGES